MNGQSLPLTAVVALISRRVVVQGNVTRERRAHLRECAKAGVARGEEVFCNRSILGSKTALLKPDRGITVY